MDASARPWLSCDQAFKLGEGAAGLGSDGRALRASSSKPISDAAGLARGAWLPQDPIEFQQAEDGQPCDLIGTTLVPVRLVSERFLGVLRDHDFRGWTTFPVRVLLECGRELHGYHGLAVTGRCGPIEDQLSQQIVMAPPAPQGRARPGLRGICFAPDSWDGSDVFQADGYAGTFVVERVRDALQSRGLTNIDLRRLSQIERNWRADGTFIRADESSS